MICFVFPNLLKIEQISVQKNKGTAKQVRRKIMAQEGKRKAG